MTAWETLKANSALLVGTAWELLTNPKPTGSGPGTIINDGYTVSLAGPVKASLGDLSRQAVVAPAIYAVLQPVQYQAKLTDNSVGVVSPAAIQVEVST